MEEHQFLKGVGIGMVAGAALSMAMAPRKKTNLKKTAGRAIRTVGEVVEHLSDAIDL